MSGRSRALSAVFVLFLSGIRAAPLQDANDDAVHSVVENLKQVLVASRHGQTAHHDEPDVLPIVEIEPTTPKSRNGSDIPVDPVTVIPGMATAVPITVVPVTIIAGTVPPSGPSPTPSPNPNPVRVVEIADKVLDDEHAMDRTSTNPQSQLTMTSISDKVQPIGDQYKNQGNSGSSVRVFAVEGPESTESVGGDVGIPTNSQEGEIHALMNEAPAPSRGPTIGDKIEDVEMLDGSVPTKLGVSVTSTKLVGDSSVPVPLFDLAEVQGLLPKDQGVAEMSNDQSEATTTYATTEGLVEIGTTEAPVINTAVAGETDGTTQQSETTTERADSTGFESLLNEPSNYLRDDIPSSKPPSEATTTLQPPTTNTEPTTRYTHQPTTVTPNEAQPTTVKPTEAQPTTGTPTEAQPTTITPHEVQPTTITLHEVQPTTNTADEERATTDSSTTPSIPEEATTTASPPPEENTDRTTEEHNDETGDIATQSTKLPQVSEFTSTAIPATNVPERVPTKAEEEVSTKPVDTYEDSVAVEDRIRPSDSLAEQPANNSYQEEFTTRVPEESWTPLPVTQRADVHKEESAEESSESQEESQEANEETQETNEQSGEISETVDQSGETSETIDQSGETGEQTEGPTEGSTVLPVTVEISTSVTETSSAPTGSSTEVTGSPGSPGSPGGSVLPPIVVNQLSAHSQISLRYARTLVETQLRNDAQSAQEARITVELPDDAFITGMTIESNGQVYRARVAERQAANQQYQEAVQHGQSAAQLVASGRNTNVFSVLVSVEPQQILGVNLTYEELLSRRRGRYRHTLTLRADQEIERTEMEVILVESRNLTALAVYAGERQLMSAEDRELALAGLSEQRVGLLQVKRQTWKSAFVTLKAVGSQQQDLWGNNGAPRQIIVEYDVDRKGAVSGDLLLMDGYFVHFFAPPDLPPLRKHAILVLDTSGSMWGRKLRQVQQAMTTILDSLHPDDYFSIVQFASQITEWSPHTLEVVGLREKEATLPATKEHISKAKKFISSMEASGGTNIGGALRSALKLAARRDFERWAGHGGSTGAPPQPLVIFLSDGLPTVGTLSASRILAQTRAANTQLRASIFSLSFGSRDNWRFLQKVSLQNHGFARRVYEAGDAAQQLHDFYREISSPLLTNVTFNYIALKVNKTTVTKRQFPLLCDGGEIVVAGRYLPGQENELLEADVEGWGGPEGSAAVEGAAPQKLLFRAQAQNITGLVPPPLPPSRVPAEPEPQIPGLLERLWAYLSIRQLLDRDLAEGTQMLGSNNSLAVDGPHGTGPTDDTPRIRALYLALKYNFVTPLTSLVVVKPSNKPGGVVTETPTDPASDLDSVADESAVHAEDFPMQNKISEMNLAKPGSDLPISFKPLLLGEDQTLNLDDIRWLSKHMDPLGRLLVNGTAYILKVPTNEELASVNSTATDQCPSIRSCQPLAKCVQGAFVDSYTIFVDYFCTLGRWAGVCCPAT